MRLPVRGFGVFRAPATAFLLVVLASGAGNAQEPVPDGGDPPKDPAFGAFIKHCAPCHGQTGRGDGPTRTIPPARDFAEGGFSFGNTEDAIFKTITSGIPGTAMASFRDLISPEERRALAAYVRGLIPEEKRKEPDSARVLVGDRPVVVAGTLPAAGEGRPLLTRGLALGLPGGWSFLYGTDPLQLREVRRGAFVRRTDWGGRGGTPLEILGAVFDGPAEEARMQALEAGDFVSERQPGPVLMDRRYLGVRTTPETIELSSELRLGTVLVATVKESPSVETLRAGMGYSRTFEVLSHAKDQAVCILIATDRERKAAISGFPEETVGSAAMPDGLTPFEGEAWLVSRIKGPEELVRIVRVESEAAAGLKNVDAGLLLVLKTGGEEPLRLRISVIQAPKFDDDVREMLASDLL